MKKSEYVTTAGTLRIASRLVGNRPHSAGVKLLTKRGLSSPESILNSRFRSN